MTSEIAAIIGWCLVGLLVIVFIGFGLEACSANSIERALERQCEKLGYADAMINEYGEFCVWYKDGQPYFVNVKEIPHDLNTGARYVIIDG
jgi:hypothetical protein